MPGEIQPLAQNFAIVDEKGFPTQYFIKWAQQRQIDIGDGISAQQAQDLIDAWSATRDIFAGVGLDGGGPLSADVTINLGDTAVTPGSYTSADITVDAQGRLTAAANGGSGGSTPVVRASSITSSSNSSYTINFPTGTVAGDVVFIFAGHGFDVNRPANWLQIDNSTGTNWNGAVFVKEMTAGDITTGSVTITTGGGFNGVFALVTIIGTGVSGLRLPGAFDRSSSGVTSAALSNFAAFSTDLILAFESTRAAVNCTFSAGITSLQAVNASDASGAVGRFTGTLTALGMAETGTFSSSGTGYYTATIAIR